jgi:hypothetical protein
MTPEKNFRISSSPWDDFKTYEEAERQAKITVEDEKRDVLIYEAVSLVKYPLPDYEVVKL